MAEQTGVDLNSLFAEMEACEALLKSLEPLNNDEVGGLIE